MTEPVFVQRLTAVTKYLQRANLTARSGLTVAIIPKEADTGARIVYGLRVLTGEGDYTEPLSYIGQLTDYEAGDRVLVAFTDEGEGVIIGVLHPSARDKTGNISEEFSGPHMPETGTDPAPVVDIVVPPGETPQYPLY